MPGRRSADGRPPMMDSGNLRLRARHPQSHQGVCADAIATLENIPREALDDLSLESQQRADRAIRERLLRQKPRAGAPRGRHARARPRGISAPADDARGPRRAQARVPGDGGRADRRGRHHLSQADHAEVSGPRHHVRAPCGLVVRRRRWRGGAAARLAGLRAAQGTEAPRESRRDGEHGRQPDLDAQRAGARGAQGARQGRARRSTTSTCSRSTRRSPWWRRNSSAILSSTARR